MAHIYVVVATFLGWAVSSLVQRLFTMLGIGAVTYYGMHAIYAQIETEINSTLSGLTGDSLAILGLMRFDYALSIIVSAGLTRAMLAGWSAITDSKSSFAKLRSGSL